MNSLKKKEAPLNKLIKEEKMKKENHINANI